MLKLQNEDFLDEVFKSIKKASIFLDRDKLTPDYVPENLPFREEQIKKIASILAQALRNSRPNNIFTYGLTGTGKTAVVKLVTKKLQERAVELKLPIQTVYVNCRQRDTSYRVLADIIESLGGHVPFTGLSLAELYRRLISKLESLGGRFIVILDEIDFIIKKQGDDLLYKLTRINEELKNSSLSMIGITNDLNFIDNLDPRIRSSLGEEEIVFPPYNALQLKSILEDRAKIAFRTGALDEGVIDLCAALAAREHGDARKALDLLRVAGEIAEREGDEKVRKEHVEKARKELEKDKVYEVVSTLPLHAKLILASIVDLTRRGKDSATTGEIFVEYSKKTSELRLETLTQRRVTDIISELDMMGLVSARVISRGRYGKTKVVKLIANLNTVLNALKDDEILESVVDVDK
ncbi:orc1/cdc6 family replication initiation protein [Fervidicoccus fontis]|uniref:ORC1-type DNA replication protein n=1 Tax=Fervidicoccus fontis TaxID=683846 RepID=A0A843AER5_9CREN|nr:orc1/cdc6 family replication initiation protein [Fervidicoccus fontis]MBE9391627.1 orc1/cdc6 family replication initiation protein [Fervidicoccus fontis]